MSELLRKITTTPYSAINHKQPCRTYILPSHSKLMKKFTKTYDNKLLKKSSISQFNLKIRETPYTTKPPLKLIPHKQTQII